MKLFDLDHVYFCTGARNNDLLNFFNHNKISYEVDERSGSFKALGKTKILGSPIAICTTSGTAVTECLSAMTEAFYSNLPFLLITGDRPKKMHGKASPQTIDHEIVTRGVRGSFIELNLEDLNQLDISLIDYPAHINVLIEKKNEKPLFSPKEYTSDWTGFDKFILENPSPLILLSHENTCMDLLGRSLKDLGIPFYGEILSGVHHESTFRFERDILKALSDKKITSVIRIGHTPLSKLWRNLEEYPYPQFSFDERGFTGLSHGSVMPINSNQLIKMDAFWTILKKSQELKIDQTHESFLIQLISKYPKSDPAVLSRLEEYIPENSLVYLGNSLIIRFFELVNKKKYQFFGNRGVNGIDGQLSTAIGIAVSTEKTVYCILGDLTTHYDLSAMKDIPHNLKLIIINNFGGRIFETMKLDSKLVLEHENNFSNIAAAFGKSYVKNDFSKLFEVNILEIETNPDATLAFLKEWDS